jgi:hypothetical protein
MATKEFLVERVKNAEEYVEKAKKRIERLKKDYATGDFHRRLTEPEPWKGYRELIQHDYDREMKSKIRDLERAQVKLAEYQKKLADVHEKKALRNIPVLMEFLNRWERGMVRYFEREYEKYIKAKRIFDVEYSEFKAHEKDYKDEWAWAKEANKKYHDFNRLWEHVLRYGKDHTSFNQKMRRDVLTEKDRKYDFIVARTMDVVGQIKDASNLRIGTKGDLNGFIKGTQGTASVNTIGAGGWNIQCYHFRTLIHKIK